MNDEKLDEKIDLKVTPEAQLPAVNPSETTDSNAWLSEVGGLGTVTGLSSAEETDRTREADGKTGQVGAQDRDIETSDHPASWRDGEHNYGNGIPHFAAHRSSSFARNLFSLIVALIASGCFALIGQCAVQVGFDWGYHIVDRFFGQAHEANQGVGAIDAGVFLVLPMFFGFAFGCFQRSWNLNRRFATSSVFLAMTAILSFASWVQSGETAIAVKVLWPAASVAFGLFGLLLGFHYYKEMRRRVRIRSLLVFGTAAIGLIAVPQLAQHDVPYIAEVLLYSGSIFAAGAGACYFARPRHRSGAILMALTATFPIMLANILNIVANLLCLALDCFGVGPHLGWRALASALFINIIAFTAASYGGLLGFKLLQRGTQ